MIVPFEVVKIEDYGVIVDDTDKPQYGDWYGLTNNKNIVIGIDRMDSSTPWFYKDNPKVIFSIGKRLDGVTLIELVDKDNLRQLSIDEYPHIEMGLTEPLNDEDVPYVPRKQREAFIKGHKANTNKYNELISFIERIKNDSSDVSEHYQIEAELLLQSLQNQPIPTEVGLDMECLHCLSIDEEKALQITEKCNDKNCEYKLKLTDKQTNSATALNYKQ